MSDKVLLVLNLIVFIATLIAAILIAITIAGCVGVITAIENPESSHAQQVDFGSCRCTEKQRRNFN